MDHALRSKLTRADKAVASLKQKVLAHDHAVSDLMSGILEAGSAIADALNGHAELSSDTGQLEPRSTTINENETFANDVNAVPDTASGATVVPGQAKPDHYPVLQLRFVEDEPFNEGDTRGIQVQAWKSAGEIAPFDVSARFTSDNEAVATVDSVGDVTAHRRGTTAVTLTMDGYPPSSLAVLVV